MPEQLVHLSYAPRAPFVDFHARSQRWAALVCHRRAGKTVACVNDLVLRGLYTKKDNPRFGYVAPFRQQAKEIAWTYLKEATEGLRSEAPRESELRVKLYNGSWITLYGADNPDALRGLYFDGLILDEYGDMKPSLMGEVIMPTLADRSGWLAIIGTPKGRNQFYDTHIRARDAEDWYYLNLKSSESGLIKPSELDQLRKEMSPEQYEQEMECSFDAAIKGTYYTHLINNAQEEGRVVDHTLFDPEQKVNVAADLGYTDSSAFWFWQPRPDGFALIDFYQNSGRPLQHYVDMLDSKPYDYQTLWLPHDAKAKSLQTGRSITQQLYQHKLPVRLTPKLSVQDGIEAVRMLLPECWFHRSNTFKGLEALRSYRRQWNDARQVFSPTPLHDWASDPSDAFRYFALVARKVKPEPTLRKTFQGLPNAPQRFTLEDLYEERERTLSISRRAGRI